MIRRRPGWTRAVRMRRAASPRFSDRDLTAFTADVLHLDEARFLERLDSDPRGQEVNLEFVMALRTQALQRRALERGKGC